MVEKSETPKLRATTRELIGRKVKNLRKSGQVPAVVYGHKKESRNLQLDEKEFLNVYKHAGQSTLIDLKVDDQKSVKVLVHEVTRDVRYRRPQHVDFYQVNLKEKLQTSIPLEFIGESAAVVDEDGIFIAVKNEVEIECLPDNLPQHIEVDISALKTFEDSIRVSDLVLPEGVIVLAEPEEVIASVSEPISEAELAELEETPAPEHETEFATDEGTTPGEEEDSTEKPEKSE